MSERTLVEATLARMHKFSQENDPIILWRPFLRDPEDDMVLEVAVAAEAKAIVAFNKRDFEGTERFGIECLSPGEFLSRLG